MLPLNNTNSLCIFANGEQVLPDLIHKLSTHHVVKSDVNVVALFSQKLRKPTKRQNNQSKEREKTENDELGLKAIGGDLVANPAAGDSELSLEVEVAKSGEKPVEDALLGGGEFDRVANLKHRRHWCARATPKRRRSGSYEGFGGTARVKKRNNYGSGLCETTQHGSFGNRHKKPCGKSHGIII